ncbi:carboxymuconolactone decarboxylase family protein [Luteibacter sp. 329MFSha]|uniref:carboxymuconolactone decarboxylase family protein n=1 Tax=Luteibacter sp. 329MFSha TaxID=1798239 RepID=UPI0008C8FFB9|nr:carboxymuconolactone decarboxylase family protein [Luteibacter sp. 329MFSha]SEV96165.1 alkylhydroperoxidase AhpD family core domain-containing protein [Luteibacter sp. 329MFSha]
MNAQTAPSQSDDSVQQPVVPKTRLDYMKEAPALTKKLMELSMVAAKSALGDTIQDLVKIRASQLNGCSFCIDMHVKEATIHGERALRLHHVAAWRESNLFVPKERAALAWTEVLTRIPAEGVPDDIYERVRGQFSEAELAELTYSIMIINAWNRANVAFRPVPGGFDKEWHLDKANLS